MIIPVRCFTCGKVIANRWDLYIRKKNEYSESGTNDNTNINIAFSLINLLNSDRIFYTS